MLRALALSALLNGLTLVACSENNLPADAVVLARCDIEPIGEQFRFTLSQADKPIESGLVDDLTSQFGADLVAWINQAKLRPKANGIVFCNVNRVGVAALAPVFAGFPKGFESVMCSDRVGFCAVPCKALKERTE